LKAYRYLDSKYGPQLAALGLYGISTTSSVGRIEGPQQDQSDGQLTHVFSGTLSGKDKHAAARMKQHGLDISESSTIQIGNMQAIHTVHGYMTCLCSNPNSKAFPGKEWVFEIKDVQAFGYELAQSSYSRLPTIADFGPVTYYENDFQALDTNVPLGNPFFKKSKYRDEEEIRIFWTTPRPVQRFNILNPKLIDHIRLISHP